MDKAILAILHSGQSAIVAGTDAPNMPGGVGLQGEIELYVRGGMTPVEALQTATINAAKALGADADLGSIEAGKLADMVIIDGNPLTDIKDTRKVNTVVKDGEVYEMKTIMSGVMPTQSSEVASAKK
jgi:imidazolonepropionase-like amidohydrolase